MVPYDDAFIASYEEGEDLPPFDMPDDASPVESAPFVPFAQAARPRSPRLGRMRKAPPRVPRAAPPRGRGVGRRLLTGPSQGKLRLPHPLALVPPPLPRLHRAQRLRAPRSRPTSAAAAQFASEVNARETPHSTEEAKEMLGNIFGSGVIFKDA